jgi:Bacterial SH3 domain
MNKKIKFRSTSIFLSFFILFISVSFFSGSVHGQDLATIIALNANLRGTPSANGKVVTVLTENSTVKVLLAQAPWYLIQSQDYAGWLHGNTLKLNDASEFDNFDTARPMVSPPTYSAPKRSTPRRSSSRGGSGYIRGPRGGCYYINSNGNKTYVDRSLCN